MPLLRTISGRIALAFVILLVTFSAVCGYSIVSLRELGREIGVVRQVYLEVALLVAQLGSRQNGIVDAITEGSPDNVRLRPWFRRNLQQREAMLAQVRERLDAVSGDAAATGHTPFVSQSREEASRLLETMQGSRPLLELALDGRASLVERRDALDKLEYRERRLGTRITTWFGNLRAETLRITTLLEQAGSRASVYAAALGGLAAVFALLVGFWAVTTLRPLRRLGDAVRQVSRGNYAQRISVTGGTEVDALAADVNAMAQAVEEREQKLVQRERLAAVGKMAAVVTHEVRNPLSSIGLNVELLDEELERLGDEAGDTPAAGRIGEARSLVRAIQKEVDRLTGITEEYLRFTRMPRPRLEREQVNEIVAGVVEFQREELASRRIAVETVLAAPLPAVFVDEAQLRQALLNLIRNSADAMEATGGCLTLTTASAEGSKPGVTVTVADTGPGIEPEHLLRLFEPFFSTKKGGTGLGLALTREIVHGHGGDIQVASRLGQGTQFVIVLPAAADAA